MKDQSPRPDSPAKYPLTACALVAIFLGFIFNRFLPVQDAWFAHYGELMRAGRLPYRDFYCFIQPLPLLIARAIVVVGGDHLIWFRVYAVGERLLLTFVLYDMLRQCFSRYAAFIGTVVSVVAMAAAADDSLFNYLPTCMLFSVAALGALARAFRTGRLSWFSVAGIFLALAFFTKQSLGGVLGVALFCVLLWTGETPRATWQRLMRVGAAFAVVGLVFAVGLFASGLMHDYMREVYFNAVGQKGGAQTILTGFWFRLNQMPFVITVVTVFTLVLVCRLAGWLRPWPETTERKTLFFGTAVVFLLGLILPVAASARFIPWYTDHRIYLSFIFVIPLTFYATLFLLMSGAVRRRQMLEAGATASPALLTLTAGAMAVMYSSGMSYEISASALAPALGVCLAYALDFFAGLLVPRIVLLALCAFLVANGATYKYLCSYWWWGWQDTSLHPTGHSRLPQLAGFNLNPAEIAIYEKVTDVIASHAAPEETVFSFPSCPLFNVLSGHLQPTFAPVHFPDVCPDAIQRRDAAYLRQNPPRIIVWLRASSAENEWAERSFRGHGPNGYQEMNATLQDLTSGGAYTLAYRALYNERFFPLEVWVRR